MSKSLPLLLFLTAVGGACAERTPQPHADPVQVRRLLASLQSEPAKPQAAVDKLARTERMIRPLERIDPEKIDPSVAEALIAR